MARNSNIIEEYLVGLGFHLDTIGFQQFSNMLRDAAHLTDQNYLAMAKSVVSFETKAVGAFLALGAGVVTFAEKTAMADQEYRLLAMRMFTGINTARELKIALDALGQPLENVIWDPELAARFAQLVKDQQTMTKELGPDFEAQMLKIRDVRFEFTRFGVELKYLTMLVVQDLAKAFGTDMDGLLQKMRNFNEYLIQNLPSIANWIATTLKPVLIDVKDIMGELWQFVKQLVLDFTNFVGLISGNSALVGKTADFQKFGEAIKETTQTLAHLVLGIMKVGTNIGLLFDAGQQALSGNYKAAIADLYKMSPIGGAAEQTPGNSPDTGLRPSTLGGTDKASIKRAIVMQATALGVPADLALAVAQAESSFRQFDASGNVLMSNKPGSHATGIFQLQPGTAAEMGVDPKDPGQNILGGVRYLKFLLRQYHGNIETALEHYYGSRNAAENKKYAKDIMAGLHIENLNITVEGHGDPRVVADAAKKGVGDAYRIQRNIAELGFPQWGY